MTDIRELLTAIHEWERAREAYDNRTPEQGNVWLAVQYAAKKVTGSFLQSDELLPAFVALADHVDALEAKIERALAIKPKVDRQGNMNYVSIAEGKVIGWNEARDEFRALLTSEPTAASASEGEA